MPKIERIGGAKTVPDLVAAAFEAFPDKPAIEFQGNRVSRAEVADRSDRLAAWLLGHGAGVGHLVGIYMDRSVEMLISILGVMKSGAAYVPLDPEFPKVRNEQILDETQVVALLTLHRHLGNVPKSGARILCLDTDSQEWETAGFDTAEPVKILAGTHAYVIFTSGSTGRPKGVEVTHGSVVNLLTSAAELLEATPQERLVAVTTLAFDISVLELLLPLVCGGTVVMADKQEASDSVRLKELLASSQATMLQATPVTFRSLLELGYEAPARFKMMCGGEAWAPSIAEKLLATGGRLWNMYGPTETTVWSSIVEVQPGVRRVTFGPPIAKTRFYVMDAETKLVPAGDEGELWIAGAGVAKGYFHREELTAERFFADPFVPGERMYRTGDEVRQLVDGTIEFIGRLDQQVKLRGYRIELGEIEAALLAIPGTKEAVAMLRQDAEGESFLAAVYVGEPQSKGGDLLTSLRHRLPSYMVPKVLVKLESLPLTPNGKTDRRAIAEMELPLSSERETKFGLEAAIRPAIQDIAVQNTAVQDLALENIEQRMLAIWQKLFPRAAIDAESSFFDLGGDSLLVVRLQSRIEREFGLRLTMADVAQHFKFSGLVEWARVSLSRDGPRANETDAELSLLPLQTRGSGAPVIVIPQMLVFRSLAEELGREQPFYGLQLPDDYVPDELATASFEELATLYCRQIRKLQPQGPYRLGGWCLWGWMVYEIGRQLEAEGAEVEMLAIIDAWAPGYWKRFSPLRQFLVNAGYFWQRLRWYADSMNSLPVHDRIADGLRRLREVSIAILRSLPRGLRPELQVVETLRIQKFASKAAESYRPGRVKANVVLFKSELRPTGAFAGEDMGWSTVLGRTVRLNALPGTHNEIFNPPAARIMAARMREALGLAPLAEHGRSGRT